MAAAIQAEDTGEQFAGSQLVRTIVQQAVDRLLAIGLLAEVLDGRLSDGQILDAWPVGLGQGQGRLGLVIGEVEDELKCLRLHGRLLRVVVRII